MPRRPAPRRSASTGRRPAPAPWPALGLRIAALAGLTAAAACNDAGPTGPDDGGLTISIAAGDAQRTLEGWALNRPLIVRVLDASGAAASGAAVRFAVAEGGGSVSLTSASTGSSGLASVAWTVGPAGSAQRVTASVGSGTASVTFEATSLGPESADLVVVRGALAGLKGFVLMEQAQDVEVLGVRGVSDTLLYVPPLDEPGASVVIFGQGNRPLRVDPAWTPGVDTVHATMIPPVAVDMVFDVLVGDFEAQRATMMDQLAATEEVWADEAMGLVLGEITFIDDTAEGRTVEKSSSGICSGLSPGDAIQIDLVTSIDGGSFTGWGCWAGHIFLGLNTFRFPNLLAHELGHTFTLEHTETGMMYPSRPGTLVNDGETYRAHFHTQSVLNTIFASQPDEQRRFCHAVPSPCLPEALEVGGAAVAVDGAQPAVVPAVAGPPVDRNPVRGIGR